MSPADDADLIARFRRGDPRAFEILLDRYLDRVVGVAARLLRDRHEALDVAQEVFLLLHKALPGWRDEGLLFSWLYRATLNVASHRLRSRRRLLKVDVPPDRPQPEPAADASERLQAIRDAVDGLPARQRDVFVLRHEAGLPLAEIGRRLGLAEGTVKAHLHRALAALRDALRSRGFL